MRIILTHEQADFDALASLLGASLLDENAIPVLPRRMNRNVRAFLTLYGMDLPFIDPRDLGNVPIESVTLVDTQALVSVRGMTVETQITVIDHHPLRDGLPNHWQMMLDETGATTTLFVEHLNEHDGLLSTVQATLLLLGIYEDTGSLTYTRTTSRDLQAAAYLLDQGASLEIATNFLNHPLSARQQILYDALRQNSEGHRIHGHSIILAIADAQNMEEELSTVAHKLRDLLDPDALFVLVITRGGIQVIARSTNDLIDVSEIVAQLGGGGHERAAAALIHDSSIEDVKARLLEILPQFIRPAISIAQLMSSAPQVITPDTPIQEVAERMRRFGYEGYPVVQHGKVVGLLNRRSVDRALAHKLDRTAKSIMEVGEYTVFPDDSIQHLQRLMSESGWGQIPVVDPITNNIIGIVTRTDLLKTLAPEARLPSRMNLAERLEAILPPGRLALLKIIAQAAYDKHAALFIVGGFVRDLLLDRPSQDFDLVVEGDAISLAQYLSLCYGGHITSHTRFSTAKWHLPTSHGVTDKPDRKVETLPDIPDLQTVDLVSARTEFYTYPTALPTVERGSIKLDLHRRDFTINTLALRLDGHHYGELHDYWGGLNDLHQGLVRVLHSLSFVDDPTRMLRAARFEQRFNFRIEDRTLSLMTDALALLERVSGDRIRHEINHIFQDEQVDAIMNRLKGLRLLEVINPFLTWDSWIEEQRKALPRHLPGAEWDLAPQTTLNSIRRDLTYIFWLMRLTSTQVRVACDRLKLPVELSKIIGEVGELYQELPALLNQPPSRIVARLEVTESLSRYAAFLSVREPAQRTLMLKYATEWRQVHPQTDGDDLRKRGLPPGPQYKEILSKLRDAWLDREIRNEEEEIQMLERLISKK